MCIKAVWCVSLRSKKIHPFVHVRFLETPLLRVYHQFRRFSLCPSAYSVGAISILLILAESLDGYEALRDRLQRFSLLFAQDWDHQLSR